jgi:hypothetical protein
MSEGPSERADRVYDMASYSAAGGRDVVVAMSWWGGGRLVWTRMKVLLATPPLLAVLGLLLVGCGASSPASSGALAELQRVAPVVQGIPTLVFVYTDG